MSYCDKIETYPRLELHFPSKHEIGGIDLTLNDLSILSQFLYTTKIKRECLSQGSENCNKKLPQVG